MSAIKLVRRIVALDPDLAEFLDARHAASVVKAEDVEIVLRLVSLPSAGDASLRRLLKSSMSAVDRLDEAGKLILFDIVEYRLRGALRPGDRDRGELGEARRRLAELVFDKPAGYFMDAVAKAFGTREPEIEDYLDQTEMEFRQIYPALLPGEREAYVEFLVGAEVGFWPAFQLIREYSNRVLQQEVGAISESGRVRKFTALLSGLTKGAESASIRTSESNSKVIVLENRRNRRGGPDRTQKELGPRMRSWLDEAGLLSEEREELVAILAEDEPSAVTKVIERSLLSIPSTEKPHAWASIEAVIETSFNEAIEEETDPAKRVPLARARRDQQWQGARRANEVLEASQQVLAEQVKGDFGGTVSTTALLKTTLDEFSKWVDLGKLVVVVVQGEEGALGVLRPLGIGKRPKGAVGPTRLAKNARDLFAAAASGEKLVLAPQATGARPLFAIDAPTEACHAFAQKARSTKVRLEI